MTCHFMNVDEIFIIFVSTCILYVEVYFILMRKCTLSQIGEVGFWAELVAKSKNLVETDSEHSEFPPLAHLDTNIYSFGILLLEIISGKLLSSNEHGPILNWVYVHWVFYWFSHIWMRYILLYNQGYFSTCTRQLNTWMIWAASTPWSIQLWNPSKITNSM